ncbi:MAG: hypothetical protein SF053_21595 [Bacteroidia bacterium]|nr:hypothetical protein [Bacteroidia bacterium]
MSDQQATTAPYHPDAYSQLCVSYRAIDDFRGKLLGFLPLVSGLSIWSTGWGGTNPVPENMHPAMGIFGLLVTLGLAIFELKGIQKCTALIRAGQQMEAAMGVTGMFASLKDSHWTRFAITEPVASAMIYATVAAAWMYIASQFCVWCAVACGVVLLVLMYVYWLCPVSRSGTPNR